MWDYGFKVRMSKYEALRFGEGGSEREGFFLGVIELFGGDEVGLLRR